MTGTHRRDIIKTSGLAIAFSTAGCIGGGGGNNSDSGKFKPMDMTAEDFKNPSNIDYEDTFNLWNWYDGFNQYTKKQLPKDFKNLNKVTTSGYSSASQWISKLQSGNYDIDVASGNVPTSSKSIENDLLSPLPVEEMPNWQSMPKDIKDNYKKHLSKNGDVYAIPDVEGKSPVLGYNSNVFDKPPTSWDILWDEEYKGKLMLQNNPVDTCMIAALYTGQDPFNPKDPKEIKEALMKQKPLNKTYWESYDTARRLFVNETVVAGPLPVGKLATAHFENNAPYIQYSIPKEGGFTSNTQYVIPANPPHPKISTLFCNWAMKPKNAIQNYLKDNYLPPLNDPAKSLKNNGVPQEEIDFVTVDKDAKMIFITPIQKKVRDRYSQIFSEVLAS